MTTIAEFANELKQRAAGWRARSHTIFNGAIIAEEIQGWADKAAALSPPEPTEGLVEALRPFAGAFDGIPPKLPDNVEIILKIDGMPFARVTVGEFRAAHTALRAMPLQDGAVTQDKRGNET